MTIAILGGKNQSEENLGDVVLLDLRTNKCTRVFNDENFLFTADTNQCVSVKPNEIFLLAADKEIRPSLMKFSRDTNKLT